MFGQRSNDHPGMLAAVHPKIGLLQKPDPATPSDQHGKRCVVPIEMEDGDPWLFGPVEHAVKLVKLAPVDVFDARPAP